MKFTDNIHFESCILILDSKCIVTPILWERSELLLECNVKIWTNVNNPTLSSISSFLVGDDLPSKTWLSPIDTRHRWHLTKTYCSIFRDSHFQSCSISGSGSLGLENFSGEMWSIFLFWQCCPFNFWGLVWHVRKPFHKHNYYSFKIFPNSDWLKAHA